MIVQVLQLGMGWFPEQPGGLNRVYYDLFHSLPLVGVKCRGVITGDRPAEGEFKDLLEIAAPLSGGLVRRCISIRRSVQRALAKNDIDLVASHFALYTAGLIGGLSSKPLVVHFHGPWAEESRSEGASSLAVKLKYLLEKRVYSRADRFIVLSRAFRDVLIQQYGIDESRIEIVPGQVDIQRFTMALTRQEARERLGWPMDRPIFVAVRRLVRRMGLENLIAAVKELRISAPDAMLMIAGKGPLAEELQQRIRDIGQQDSIKLLGYVSDSDLPTIYRAADCSVVPTTALEGFGLIAAESLAAGTPVLVTPVGGLPEVVEELSPALVMKSTEAADIADAMRSVLLHQVVLPDENQCRAYAVSRYDRKVVAEKIKKVYINALAGKSVTGAKFNS